MQENKTKVILLTILITMLTLIAICLGLFAILYFGMPKELADFTYSLGNERFASNLYYKAYKKSGDIDVCYKALNLKIKLSDGEGIVEIYEAYLQDDDYESYNQMMETYKKYLDCSVLEMSVILNEVDYLESRYIGALIKLGKHDVAFDRAIDNFEKYNDFDLQNQGAYNLNYFITNTADFNKVYENYTLTLIEAMQDYFDKSYTIFSNNTYTEDDLEKAYLVALGNRLILVGQNINTIYTANSSNSDKCQNNEAIMQEVNNAIKGIIN